MIKKQLNLFPELSGFILHDWLFYAIIRHHKYGWFIDSVPKMYYRQHDGNQVGANSSFKAIIFRVIYILSGHAFDSIRLLASTLNIPSIQLTSRVGVLKLALNARQLRRRRIDQFFVFFALFFYAIRGPKK